MCHADTYSRHRAGVSATVTSLCGKPSDRYAFPLWDVWDLPWTTRGRSVWAWRHCPCVGKICHVARTFLGSACPGQLVTHPRWRGLENARVGLLPLINSREAISISCGAVSIRVINSPSRSAVGKETRKPKPKQARTAPKTQQPREAKRGRKHKRKPQEEAKQKTKP